MDNHLFIKSGDGHYLSFEEIYKSHITSLLQYGLKFTKDKDLVKDCIHELFIDLYRYRESLGEIYKIKPYLIKCLKSKLTKSVLANQKIVSLSNEDLPFIAGYSMELVLDDEETQQIKKNILANLLKQLPSRQKEAIYLRFEEGLEYDEIAYIMKCNYQSSRNLVHRAISKIRDLITDNEIFDLNC